jgi:hypothetical protein
MGDRSVTPDFVGTVKTITVTEALKRVARVVDDYKEPGAYVSVLLETRNGIVHAGHTAGQEGEAVLGDVARYVPSLLAAVGLMRRTTGETPRTSSRSMRNGASTKSRLCSSASSKRRATATPRLSRTCLKPPSLRSLPRSSLEAQRTISRRSR